MSVSVRMEVVGFAELEKAMQKLRQEMGGKEGNITNLALKTVAGSVEQRMKALAYPANDTGRLQRSMRECGGEYGWLYGGCAKAHGIEPPTWPSPTHEYALWFAEHKCVPFHEACHALYEIRHHSIRFNLRVMQGDWLAACP